MLLGSCHYVFSQIPTTITSLDQNSVTVTSLISASCHTVTLEIRGVWCLSKVKIPDPVVVLAVARFPGGGSKPSMASF